MTLRFPIARTILRKGVKRKATFRKSAGKISVSLKHTMNYEIRKQDGRASVLARLRLPDCLSFSERLALPSTFFTPSALRR